MHGGVPAVTNLVLSGVICAPVRFGVEAVATGLAVVACTPYCWCPVEVSDEVI